MTISQQIQDFSARYGRKVVVDGVSWQYYCLGAGEPILWLTGGLRRAALGFALLERLAAHHTVLAPDYPPVQTIAAYLRAFDAIVAAEGVTSFALGGQSYGGLLAQAYLARRPACVSRLILSSTGPADYDRAWLAADYLAIGLARLLPERAVKKMLVGGMTRMITLPEAERLEWLAAIDAVVREELTRADVVAHFAVAADLIRRRMVTPAAYRAWTGVVVVLSARNDPTQSPSDIARYEKLFGQRVQVVDMGDMGHTAAIFNPDKYVALLEDGIRL